MWPYHRRQAWDFNSRPQLISLAEQNYLLERARIRAEKNYRYAERYGAATRELQGLKNLINDYGTLHGISNDPWGLNRLQTTPRQAWDNEDMSDSLDKTITLRQLVDAAAEVEREWHASRAALSMGPSAGHSQSYKLVQLIQKQLEQTDFVRVKFGTSSIGYTFRLANQPTGRRVQVGDLVTVPPNSHSSQPQVARVSEINVPRPATINVKPAVAISPDDAARIENAVGTVR